MDKDASQMTDEELDQMIEPSSELDQSPSEPTTKEAVVEEQEEPVANVEEAAPAEEEAQEEVPQPVSRRENLRIQQVLERIKQQQEPVAPVVPTGIDYANALDADPEVIRQLEADRQASAQAAYNQGLEQTKSIQFLTRLDIDAPKVESKYPILNKDDAQNFNPAVADAINSWYLNTVGFDPVSQRVQNPNVRYTDFVEGIMELGEVLGGKQAAATAKNVAKQAATTGLRPDGSSAKRMNLNQAPQNMSDEELDAILSQAFPKR